MPTYEYECKACGHRFERLQNMRESPVRTCPRCGDTVRRLISAGAGVLIKGSDSSCRLRSDGKTCCGREERCLKPPCGETR